ncbi:double-strand break repair helicase AddA [Acetobacter okinawensis]|uniref:double-strand break repair helicase AddA n=1 Tax=Acetobacter okinawensis TaxID=1076594 RepID=UPI0020A11306|nr:double-strand break repair helicase AddA [Acetobacter okinawensis]MCP1212883.1 double-strand break repair helicase AddA [Acetobacter okinawensis]
MSTPPSQNALDAAIAQANQQQAMASDPTASVFVSASAGSGKTKLLIDRLLRLMLPRVGADGAIVPGSDPARILCLTFTKAAAAEMAIRLQTRLGRWVTLPDTRLDAELAALSVPCTEQTRRKARALFAEVLDLPGGMRIGTIHAFCQSLLRRFPLEASMNPHFTVMEETDAALALQSCVESVLGGQPQATVAPLAGQIGLGDFMALAGVLRRDPRAQAARALVSTQPEQAQALLCRVLNLPAQAAQQTDEAFLHAACTDFADESILRSGLAVLLVEGSATAKANAQALLDWLALYPPERAAQWSVWRNGLLTKDGKPRSRGLLSTKLAEKYTDLADALHREATRILEVEEGLNARQLARLGAALLTMAAPVATLFDQRKAMQGQLEYDDLIHRTLSLLRTPGAAWVLYKLDGGIDHLLLDEVQDTSPQQWRIAGDLTEEFFAGAGTRTEEDGPRTVFAVGDYKQSIYAFQGADPDEFRDWRARFKQRAQGANLPWREPELTVSFRSTAPVLQLVDAVFADAQAARGVAEEQGRPMRHITARPGQGGRVELWPLAEVEGDEQGISPWQPTAVNATRQSPRQKLADALASTIARELAAPAVPGQKPLTPGDVLVLVPRRSSFVPLLVRALKGHNIPVATLVRTGLADQLVVQDLMALCAALLLPQDDLTLGCVLTSPLGGLSDDSLMALAVGRTPGAPLWSTLRERHAQRADWAQAWTMLNTLFGRVDYLTPYELLCAALGQQGGRARLLARLGPEAAEPMDELLSAALRYQEQHPPSLQGFLHWLRHSQETVKREAEAGGNAVRVMTAHGSKGLQARLVILPDTVGTPRFEDRLFWAQDKKTQVDVPLYVPRNALSVGLTRSLYEGLRDKAVEEYNRLLYVALTRAADRLVVCGWKPGRTVPPESWYERCRLGFERAGAQEQDWSVGDWSGKILVLEEHASPPALPASPSAVAPVEHSAAPCCLPGWVGQAPLWRATPPVAEGPLARPLAPSRPDDTMLGPLPPARSPLDVAAITPAKAREAAFRKGNLVHSLLQFLPEHPVAEQERLATDWLARPAAGLTAAEAATLAAQIVAVLRMPALVDLFAPQARAEQRLAGIAGGQVIVGQVDRMCVLPDRVVVCDYKSGRHAPRTVEQTPVLYLRQMAAYRALLQGLWPDRQVVCVLVWTELPRADQLPDSLLDRHVPTPGGGGAS